MATNLSNEFKNVILSWIEYKQERGDRPYTKRSLQTFCDKLFELSDNNAKIAQEIIDQSIANNWAGIFPVRNSYNSSQYILDYLTPTQDKDESDVEIVQNIVPKQKSDEQIKLERVFEEVDYIMTKFGKKTKKCNKSTTYIPDFKFKAFKSTHGWLKVSELHKLTTDLLAQGYCNLDVVVRPPRNEFGHIFGYLELINEKKVVIR